MASSKNDIDKIFEDLPSLNEDQLDLNNLQSSYFTMFQQPQEQENYDDFLLGNAEIAENINYNELKPFNPISSPQQIFTYLPFVVSELQLYKCSRCGVSKPTGEFGSHRNGKRLRCCRRCTASRRITRMVRRFFKDEWHQQNTKNVYRKSH